MNTPTQRNRFFAALLTILGLLLAAGAQAAPGQADTTFGNNGRVGLLFPANVESTVDGMVIQPDGKIVVAGICGSALKVICIARQLPNGDPDPGFNATGTFITTDSIFTNAFAIKIVLQRDRKLVIASTCEPAIFCAIRLNADGTRDNSFGMNGKTIVAARAAQSITEAFTEQRDGKLVFAGRCTPAANEPQSANLCVARVSANGLVDASFGVGGTAFVETPIGVESRSIIAVAISEQADGKLVLSGRCVLLAAPPMPEATTPCAIRLQGNGTRDASYGVNGFASARISSDNFFSAQAAIMQPDESVVVGGLCDLNGSYISCIARFDRSGMADATLQHHAAPAQSNFALQSLHLQRDGKLLAAGGCGRSASNDSRVCFLRYHSDGSLDASMPVVVDNAVLDAVGVSITTQADGKIVVASIYRDAASTLKSSLHRYQGGPFAATQCSLDIDGDGIFNPAIDGLLLTRATLGFTGPAVYAGITFPGNALRKQWGNGGDDDIRKFLVAQCGMRLN